PGLRIPRRSTFHRVAAIALYRALLSQCRKLPSNTSLKPKQCDQISTLIRNRFRQTRFQDSRLRLRVAFDAGYEAIDLLDAVVAGQRGSRSRILEILKSTPSQAKDKIWQRPVDRSRREKEAKREARQRAVEVKPSPILERPLPLDMLKGKRHIPLLVNANKIPFLRIKKPQPESLSKVIRTKIRMRQKRHDLRQMMDQHSVVGMQEDIWDQALTSETGLKSGNSWEPSWYDAFEIGMSEVERAIAFETRKNRELAGKMQEIVDKEKALKAQEKA
ncbi:hypothetical protein K431DRAFT_205022, partial [Polychaeton citri CBS 116435]